jgi:hypothetical protein
MRIQIGNFGRKHVQYYMCVVVRHRFRAANSEEEKRSLKTCVRVTLE